MDSPDMTRISAQIAIGAAITPTRGPSTTLASSNRVPGPITYSDMVYPNQKKFPNTKKKP
jgi:hypothetical protein